MTPKVVLTIVLTAGYFAGVVGSFLTLLIGSIESTQSDSRMGWFQTFGFIWLWPINFLYWIIFRQDLFGSDETPRS